MIENTEIPKTIFVDRNTVIFVILIIGCFLCLYTQIEYLNSYRKIQTDRIDRLYEIIIDLATEQNINEF